MPPGFEWLIHFTFDTLPSWFLIAIFVAIFTLIEWVWGKFRRRRYARRT